MRRPYGRWQPPPAPPKLGGELTANTLQAASNTVFCIGSPPILGGVRGGKSAYSDALHHVSLSPY